MLKTNKSDIFRFSLYEDPNIQFEKIHWKYIPIAYDNFITICTDNIYQYWGEAVEMVLAPLYANNIRIVAFSLQNSANIQGSLNINNIDIRQAAFLLEKTKYHFCGQDWSLTLCQNNNLHKNVFLQTGDKTENFRKEYCDCIEEQGEPELVAKQIFNKLKISHDVFIKTKLIGPSYGIEILEMIPDFDLNAKPDIQENSLIGIRCDLVENWDFVLKAVSFGLRPVVISKTLPPLPIAALLSGIKSINLYVSETTLPEHVKAVQSTGITVKLLSYGENSEKVRRNLFDCDNIFPLENWSENNLDKLKELPYDTKLRTKKILVGKDGTFLSVFHWKNNLPISEKKGTMLLEAIDDKEFLVEADTFYYYI